MIKSVTIINHLINDSVKIALSDGNPSHGLIINKINGLGPATAAINTTNLVTDDGSIYNSSRLEERNIVFSILLDDSYSSIEKVRHFLYRIFPPKQEVEIIFETDVRSLKTIGRVESNEADIFTNNELASISILCPDPYFYRAGDNEIQSTTLYGVVPMFEFPFSNESLTERKIIFGEIEDKKESIIVYDGDNEIGVTINIHATGPVGDLLIYNERTREIMRIHEDLLGEITGSGIIAGDDIILTTERRKKSAKLLRNGEYTNILNALDRGTNWIRLLKGENLLAYTASYGSEKVKIQIDNRTSFVGV